ncbi:glycosyltransferase family 2 protein [Cellulomonas hominis]|uniref:glycosyltransferase family 2 protein n=1 Tax=Cellulomonas hominis TaxID=156981 RepID=UPI001FF9EDD0|nr:glycosyltransferase family 2 protein [Cellulomonas hominis]
MTPRATVGVPVYNGETYLRQALDSVRAQDEADIEIVISDNGSTDGTEEICRGAAAADDRIRYIRHPKNQGGAWNFNFLVDQARAPYFTWAAADDVRHPAFVRRCLEHFAASSPATVLVCPRTQVIDATGAVTEDLRDRTLVVDEREPHLRMRHVLRARAAHFVYGLHRVDALRSTRGIRRNVCNDFVLLTELACRGPFGLVPEQLFLQRRHAAQSSAQGTDMVRWHAPEARVRFAFPFSYVNLELVTAVLSSPLDAGDRARCLAEVPLSWTLPQWRSVASDVRTALGVRPAHA